MSDYISREAALAFHDELAVLLCKDVVTGDVMSATKDADLVKYLLSIPAADVRPVQKGKWTKELHPKVRYNQYKCSICGEFSGHNSEGWIWKPNYCPNCGADMREGS